MYPYDFKPSRDWPQHDLIFVAMPFAEDYKWIYDDIIVPAAEACGMTAWRADNDSTTKVGWMDILEHLFSASITLGVLCNDNANVYYELGIAHATQSLDRQILLVPDDRQKKNVKFDVQHLIYTTYVNRNEPDANVESLKRLVEVIKQTQGYSEELDRNRIKHAVRRLPMFTLEVAVRIIQSIESKGKQGSHFSGSHVFQCLPQNTNNPESIAYLIIRDLLNLNLIRLSVNFKNANDRTYSYYWTELGINVLEFAKIITPNVKRKWLREYRDHEKNGRFLVSNSM